MGNNILVVVLIVVAAIAVCVIAFLKRKKRAGVQVECAEGSNGHGTQGTQQDAEDTDDDTGGPKLTSQEKEGLLALLGPTALTYIKLTPVKKTLSVFDSKMGGVPYLPPGFDYPYNTDPESDKKPLKLLAQLNFAQLPHLEGYPSEGILQFYIAYEPKADTYGLDFMDDSNPLGWRLAYHKDILDDESLLQSPPELDSGGEECFPLRGEFGFEAQLAEEFLSCSDFRWEGFIEDSVESTPLYASLLEKYAEEDIDGILIHASGGDGIKIGGYPHFAQVDYRGYNDGKNTAMLLQLDMWGDDEGGGIMFGDSGAAKWFLTPEALAEMDLSDVMYHWDCY